VVVGVQGHAPRKTRYRLYRRVGGPSVGLDGCGKYRHPLGLDPRNVQPAASRSTDWATPVRYMCKWDECCSCQSMPTVCCHMSRLSPEPCLPDDSSLSHCRNIQTISNAVKWAHSVETSQLLQWKIFTLRRPYWANPKCEQHSNIPDAVSTSLHDCNQTAFSALQVLCKFEVYMNI